MFFIVDISIKADNKGGVHKVDIFDAHNFDLDINVDTIQVRKGKKPQKWMNLRKTHIKKGVFLVVGF